MKIFFIAYFLGDVFMLNMLHCVDKTILDIFVFVFNSLYNAIETVIYRIALPLQSFSYVFGMFKKLHAIFGDGTTFIKRLYLSRKRQTTNCSKT